MSKVDNEIYVSVIIPTFNSEKYIGKIIENLREQFYSNFQILIADDGSTDSTINIVDKYAVLDDRIYLLKLEHKGVSAARNSAILYAQGDIIVFVDADDEIEKSYLSKLISQFTNPRVDLAVCSYIYEDENHNVIRRFDKDDRTPKILNSTEAGRATFNLDGFEGYVWNKAFKKDIIINGSVNFNESISIYEDMLFVLDYLKFADCISFLNTPLYHYISHSESAMMKYDVKRHESGLRAIQLMWEDTHDKIIKQCSATLYVRQYLIWIEHLSRQKEKKSYDFTRIKRMLFVSMLDVKKEIYQYKYNKLMLGVSRVFGVGFALALRRFINIWR